MITSIPPSSLTATRNDYSTFSPSAVQLRLIQVSTEREYEKNLRGSKQIRATRMYRQTHEEDCCMSGELTLPHDKSVPTHAVTTDYMRKTCTRAQDSSFGRKII